MVEQSDGLKKSEGSSGRHLPVGDQGRRKVFSSFSVGSAERRSGAAAADWTQSAAEPGLHLQSPL